MNIQKNIFILMAVVICWSQGAYSKGLTSTFECTVPVHNPYYDSLFIDFNEPGMTPMVDIKIRLNADLKERSSKVANLKIVNEAEEMSKLYEYKPTDKPGASVLPDFGKFDFVFDKDKNTHQWVHDLGGFTFTRPYLTLKKESETVQTPVLVGILRYNFMVFGGGDAGELGKCKQIINQTKH